MPGTADPTTPLLTVDAIVHVDRVVVRLVGELDMAGTEVVKAAAEGWVLNKPCVELDLAELRFIDSIGADVLMDLRRRVIERGCTLTACHASRQVAMVLHLTGAGPPLGLSSHPKKRAPLASA